MGSVCCINRKELNTDFVFSNTNNIEAYYPTIMYGDYLTEAITEEDVKKMYSNANREENLDLLLILIDNESKISFDERLLKSNWFSKPNTLGDLVIIQIQTIIQKKIRGINFDENINRDAHLSRRGKEFVRKIHECKLIEKMSEHLNSESCTKKDISILVLCSLSECKHFIDYLANNDMILKIINHVNGFKIMKYKNYREHIIISFQLLRRIYIKDIQLRRYFIEQGGAQLIKEFLVSADIDLIQETLYNIEDLIYNEETEYQTVSKLLIYETIDKLITLQYDKAIFDLYNEYNKNKQKYCRLADDIRRLIAIFGCKDIIATNNTVDL